MKINRSSQSKLICEDDAFWAYFTQFFIIGVVGIACYSYGCHTSNSSFKIGLYAFIIGLLVCLFSWQSTTVFDLKRKSVQFHKYWFSFKGRQCKEIPLSSIKNIEVYRSSKGAYTPAVRLQSNRVMFMSSIPMDQASASQDVAIVRRFLGFD
jgi:hypothetical protein